MHFVCKFTAPVSVELKCGFNQFHSGGSIIQIRVYTWCSWLTRNIQSILQSCNEKGHALNGALDLLMIFKMICTLR